MRRDEHERECVEKLGKPFTEVHKWLDAFAFKYDFGTQHRKCRHHLKGIGDAGFLFGEGAKEAARLHVIADLKQEGWKEGSDRIPKDTDDYVRMGLW